MNITTIAPEAAALLARATGYDLALLVYAAFEGDDLTVDVQVARRLDGSYLLSVLVHAEERIERDVEFLLGKLNSMDPGVQAAVLSVWASTIQAVAARSQARVAAAMAAGRT